MATYLHAARESERLGRFAIGEQSYFELDVAGHLYRTVNNSREVWALPESGRPVEIEVMGERGLQGVRYIPLAVTSDGDLYRGETETGTWTLIGHLPGTRAGWPINGNELLATDPLKPGRLFWSHGTTVWTSPDAGKSWSEVDTVPSEISRLVLTGEGKLITFMRSGLVSHGDLTTAESGEVTWSPTVEALAIHGDDQAYFLGRNRWGTAGRTGASRIVSVGAENQGDIETGRLDSGQLSHSEISTRNSTTAGCVWRVWKWDNNGDGWVLDNYWDFKHPRKQIKVKYEVISSKSAPENCTWEAPFTAHGSITISITPNRAAEDFPVKGHAGERWITITQNDAPLPFIRFFFLHAEDPSLYTASQDLQLPMGVNDLGVVVAQDSKNNLTACQALALAPTVAEVKAAKLRQFIVADVRGTNANCPAVKQRAIACVGMTRFGQQPQSSFLSPAAILAPRSTPGGQGECILP